MSGARPTHLTRRGAVYVARFRLPADLARRLGMTELRRSLETKDLAEARRRCLLAATWFSETVQQLRQMPDVTRSDLEAAAVRFFETLRLEVDRPRQLPAGDFGQELDFQLATTRERIAALDGQLLENTFAPSVEWNAAAFMQMLGTTLPELTEQLRTVALQLAARAEREQMNYLSHQLTTPASQFEPSDKLFAADARPPSPISALWNPPALSSGAQKTLAEAAGEYIRKKRIKGVGQSQITELERSLGWLQEVLGQDTPIDRISKEEMRRFRNDIERLEVTLRGRHSPFRDRLTNDPARQIKSATSMRYWNATRGFFAWCADEFSIPADPTLGLKIERRKGEKRNSPEPFSEAELRKFFATPVFTGYAPPRSYSTHGPCHTRGQHFWAGILPLFSGIRAGELSQLQLSDFVFDHEVPHIKVRETDDTGAVVKTTKNEASIRDVPIAPVLLKLGLREFVAARSRYPKHRVFEAFRLGTKGRKSDGMTKFWGAYLKTFGLWKRGRATHVARHTVVARLRALEVAEEDIQALVGHKRNTVTAGYGGTYPLARKAKTAALLDYGFDVLAELGGVYDPARHAL